MTDIIRAEDVRYSYADGHEALRGVTVSIEEGSKVALVGPNGAGKSTLMLMLNGTLRPTSGRITYRGAPMRYGSGDLREIRRRVGMVFQNPDDQIFAPTVREDVAFGPVNLGYPEEKVDRYVGYAIRYVGLEGYEKRPPHHLSGGEKRRVSIAGVLAMEPEVMVLDEPTSNLDPAGGEEIMEMLDELNLYGKTVVISTHDVELAYRWADEVVLMDGGIVLRHGPPESVFTDSAILRRARMKLPVLIELYRELVYRGVITDGSDPPRSILGLVDALERRTGRTSRKAPGRIIICDLDLTDAREIRDLLASGEVSYIGAMGSRAKQMAHDELLDLDFSYGVIDKCILKAIAGKNSLIITSGGMVAHTARRISDYGEEFGVKIKTAGLAPAKRIG